MKPAKIAYCPPALLSCPVFQPLQRGNRPPLLALCTRAGKRYSWTAPKALGISDQTVLFALLAIARIQSQSPSGWENKVLIDANARQFNATLDDVALHARMARGGSGRETIAGALQRLAELELQVIHADETATQRWMRYTWGEQGMSGFSLCPQALCALAGQEYAAINLEERFSFRTELGRALHASLSQAVNPGRAVLFRTSTLLARLYSDVGNAASAARRLRRLDDELEQLARLPGWYVIQEGDLRRIGRQRKRVASSETAAKQRPEAGRHNETPHAALPMSAGPQKSCRHLGEELMGLLTQIE